MANGPAEAAKIFRISDASIIGDGFGGPTKKGRSVPEVGGRRSGQAKRVCRLRHDCRGPEATRAETIAVHRWAKLGTSPQRVYTDRRRLSGLCNPSFIRVATPKAGSDSD